MNETQKKLVKQSWAAVVPIAEQAADIFYGKLFEADPALKPLFKGDMKAQGKKLMQMISVAVAGLDRLGDIVPAVQALGKRHVAYGVHDGHYDTVGGALIDTLSVGLGAAFTPEVKDAWIAVYGVLSTTMKDAAKAG